MEPNHQLLPDPLNNRVVKSLPRPPHRPIAKKKMFINKKKVDWKYLLQFLKCEGRVSKEDFKYLIKITKQILKNQPNLIKLNDPVIIVGDIHGQYYDLIKLLELGESPGDINYVFLGDYVDRGSFSIEVLLLLFSLKMTYPNQVYLLRGNHQTRQMTSYFNFKEECLSKYDQEIYNEIMDIFDCLPITALINQSFFCTHGGLSPQLINIQAIDKLQRFQQTPREGVLCDFLWADPIQDQKDGKLGKLVKQNEARGCSFLFGQELTQKFLFQNDIQCIIRAHEVQNEGYKFYKWGAKNTFPEIVTVFSAPNYCDVYDNIGAVLSIRKGLVQVMQFDSSPHPYFLPKFLDLFNWTLPFIAEKVTHMFHHLLKHDESDSQSADDQIEYKAKLVQELYEMQHQQKLYLQNLVCLNGRLPDDKLIDKGVFIDSQQQGQTIYSINKQADRINQKRPQL